MHPKYLRKNREKNVAKIGTKKIQKSAQKIMDKWANFDFEIERKTDAKMHPKRMN